MSGQRTLWDDPEEGRRRRDEGMARAARSAGAAWLDEAHDALLAVARRQPSLTSEDVRDELRERGVPEPPTTMRTLGNVMTRGRDAGAIAPLTWGEHARNPTSHRGPKQRWRSLLYRAT